MATVRMIGHADFATIRLRDFLPGFVVTPRGHNDPGVAARFRGTAIIEVDRWEFDGHDCIGELFGFTEVLRLACAPDRTRSIALDLEELPAPAQRALFARLRLPLRRGMKAAAIKRLLGQPRAVERFASDRESLNFRMTAPAYRISCTVTHANGLTYVVVIRAR
jgi:hypothetical protein